jgi:hypothetical protein
LLFIKQKLCVLLPIEPAENRVTGHGSSLNVFGGKRDDDDERDFEIATREFSEETAGLVSRKEASKMLHASGAIFPTFPKYVSSGKYMLFAFMLDPSYKNLPERYKSKSSKPFSAEADSLVWIPVESLIHCFQHASDTISRPGSDAQLPVSNFFRKVLAEPDLFPDLIRGVGNFYANRVESSIKSVESQLKLSQSEFEAKILDPKWRLNLTAPPAPPPSPIRVFLPGDAEFKRYLSDFPSTAHPQITRIRRVDVSTRSSAFAAAGQKLIKEGKSPTIIEPVFHGTPDQWRATAIAIHGFDLNITLNGRALGTGVYSSTDIGIPMGYTRNAGSVLLMKGHVVQGSTVVSGPVHVFPQADHVLPLSIADIGSLASTTDPKTSSSHDARKTPAVDHKKMLAKIKEAESKFAQDLYKRWKSASLFFLARLRSLKRQLLPELASVESCARAFLLEKSQYDAMLPIYASKEKLLQEIQRNDVVVLVSGTGSGKSTQLPQYLLDDVLNANDKRKIAVLQPRRVNCMSLCDRVGFERDSDVEVRLAELVSSLISPSHSYFSFLEGCVFGWRRKEQRHKGYQDRVHDPRTVFADVQESQKRGIAVRRCGD